MLNVLASARYDGEMSADRIVLPTEVRKYFAAIGRRGGKGDAKKTATPPLKLTRKQQEIFGKAKRK